MIQAKGYAAAEPKKDLAPFTFTRREPGPNDVLIDIKYCGICHSDIHQARDERFVGVFPMVPGHEIAGVVSKVGDKVSKYKVGDAVGVGCFVDSCRKCEPCKQGSENYCEKGMISTYNARLPDNKTTYGGYSNCIVVDENYVLRMPPSISLAEAAPLLCAGTTMYSPLKHWKAAPGKKVAIIGLGGLGHVGVKIAKAMGAEVTVLSQSDKKKDDAIRLGAKHLFATSDPNTFKILANTFDLILNTVSADIDWAAYVNLLRFDGTIVALGLPDSKEITIEVAPLIWKRKSVAGSIIGGTEETQEMLDFCEKHKIGCDIEIIPIQKVNEAYERTLKSDVKFRFVIDLKSLE
jgi:uncharacterized zinc-type alcohol dehydrogenase-like protein